MEHAIDPFIYLFGIFVLAVFVAEPTAAHIVKTQPGENAAAKARARYREESKTASIIGEMGDGRTGRSLRIYHGPTGGPP